jgi:pimeloyl-ACP methyl ester carboxylesterase
VTRNRLSARSNLPGLVLAPTLRIEGDEEDKLARRLTILIHGYNNSEQAAEQSYERFEEALLQARVPSSSLGAIWVLHWPSDDPAKWLSRASYAARVPEAPYVGRLLVADFLAQLSPRQEVNLVAHSLGCRVTLEAALAIRNSGTSWSGARIRLVALLAAAVPQLLCTREYPFDRPLAGSQEHAFFSTRDKALGRLFDVGQRFYGEAGEAVGLDGRPELRWDDTLDTDLEHGEYWGSVQVAGRVGALADIVSPPRTARRRRRRSTSPSRLTHDTRTTPRRQRNRRRRR